MLLGQVFPNYSISPVKITVLLLLPLGSEALPMTSQVNNRKVATHAAKKSLFKMPRLKGQAKNLKKSKTKWQKVHMMVTAIALGIIVWLVYKILLYTMPVRTPTLREPNPFMNHPDITEYEVMRNISSIREGHDADDDGDKCHNCIFEVWEYKSRIAYSLTRPPSQRSFRGFPHLKRWVCDVCDKRINICYYAKGIACWHCTNFAKHEEHNGFHICRKCVAGGRSKNCMQCNDEFAKVFSTDHDTLCLPCVGYNNLIAARNKILDTAGVTIRGLPDRVDYAARRERDWLLISKKIEDPATIVSLTNQMKLFKVDYVYPKDGDEWSLDEVKRILEGEVNDTDQADDVFDEVENILNNITPSQIIICPSYDYIWERSRVHPHIPISYQEKILGLINSYEADGKNNTYFFMLCGYTHRTNRYNLVT